MKIFRISRYEARLASSILPKDTRTAGGSLAETALYELVPLCPPATAAAHVVPLLLRHSAQHSLNDVA